MYNNYIPTNENLKAVFGSNNPVCMSGPELYAYAKEHDLLHELLRFRFRLATEEDISRWGVRSAPMSPVDFDTLWACAVESPAKDMYIADTAISRLWGDIDAFDPIPDARIEFLESLWDAAHGTLQMFANRVGMSTGNLCQTMGIDYLAYQRWQADPKSIPEYVRIMMSRALHIIPSVYGKTRNVEVTPAAFQQLWWNAMDTRSKEHFVADNGLSAVWLASEDIYDSEDVFVVVPNERIEFLENLWDAAHGTLQMFAVQSDLGIGDLCRLMGIDHHTSQLWQANPKSMPEYVRVMMARAIGMI